MKKRILFILEYFLPHIGGVEILFKNLIFGLEKKGFDIIILTSKFDKTLPDVEKLSDNVVIYRIGKNRYDFMFKCFFLGNKLAKKVDLIHTTTYTAAIPAWLIAKKNKKKVVITVHEVFGKLWFRFFCRLGFFYKKFEDLIFSLSFDKYICVSNYTKNSLRLIYGISDNKLITIYNGIDYKLWNKNNFTEINKVKCKLHLDKYYSALYFGRPGISKGLEYLLKSVCIINKEIKNFHLFCILSRNDKKRFNYIVNLIKNLGINDYVTLLEPVKYNELGNYILSVDVVVVPSLVEGFGFSAGETSALGKELVVTNVGALPEVVSGKVNFVEPSNPEDIAQKLLDFKNGKYKLIEDKKFYWSENIEKTIEIYKNLLKVKS